MGIKYENTLFFQINSCSRYLHLAFEQLIKELDLGINALEFLALSVITDTKDCCQRDLARLILKDRSNTGKLANTLYKKGYINIELKTKNNRPVKILTPSDKGIEIYKKAKKVTDPLYKKFESSISKKIINEMMDNLKNLKNIVKNTVITTI